MSNASTDDIDDFDLPLIIDDAIATGAAADSSALDDRLKPLPRLLRYAILASTADVHIASRLAAEIDEICPNLPLNAEWLASRETVIGLSLGTDVGLTLAIELDLRAARDDKPGLRSMADCVRLLCLPAARDQNYFQDYRRVAKALLLAFNKVARQSGDEELCAELEQICFGWAALPCCNHMMSSSHSAAFAAALLGPRMAEHRVAAAKAALWQRLKERQEKESSKESEATSDKTAQIDSSTSDLVPEHHLVVARLSDEQMKNTKLREVIGPLKSVINTALPLVVAPPLHQARNILMFEFPYAIDVIDITLADLVGRATVHLRPLLLVGDPGGGKSRFARRLGEVLGLNVWRVDASRSDGAVFGGTDKRWYSAEPCHPFLAIGQGKQANPLVLLDELEKAGTRADYGRLWDCLLGFLEPETNCRYPDPALQVTLDLSHVSYIATANSIDALPSPIRDRFRIISFPKPSASDLDALLPAVIADLARERGLDHRWVNPLDGTERMAITAYWRGGSVRRLRRLVEAILRERDLRAVRN